MNQREIEIMILEENFKETLQNEIKKQHEKNKENTQIDIENIKYIGEVTWKDKISNKPLTDKVFFVEIEITKLDKEGKQIIKKQEDCYLGNQYVGARIFNSQIAFKESFQNSEPEKVNAINKLLERTNEQEIEENSLNELQKKEMQEVLSAYYGRAVKENEVEKLLEEMNKEEVQELQEEKEKRQKEGKDEKDLSRKQRDNIKVKGVQKADLHEKVDGTETLGKRLDLEEYDYIYVINSEKVSEITDGLNRNNTTYSLVGMNKNGEARVLEDEFEIDKSAGIDASKEQTKIKADSTATRDNEDISVYRRKTNGMCIGCEKEFGIINMYMYQKTIGKNENMGIQIETKQTKTIPIETKEIMNKNKGIYQIDNVQNEIEEHMDEDCEPQNIEDFDGNDNTGTHKHIQNEEVINRAVEEIYNYRNEFGEEKIKDIFTENEVKEKLIREMEEVKGNLSIEEIVEKVKEEMNADAQYLDKERTI